MTAANAHANFNRNQDGQIKINYVSNPLKSIIYGIIMLESGYETIFTSITYLLTIITSCKVGGPGTMSIHAIGAMGGQPLLEPLLKEILNGKHRYAWLYANRVAVSSYVRMYYNYV